MMKWSCICSEEQFRLDGRNEPSAVKRMHNPQGRDNIMSLSSFISSSSYLFCFIKVSTVSPAVWCRMPFQGRAARMAVPEHWEAILWLTKTVSRGSSGSCVSGPPLQLSLGVFFINAADQREYQS